MLNSTEGAEDRLMTPKEVADRLRKHTDTLKRWRAKGWGPCYITLDGGEIRYRESDLTTYLTTRTTETTVASVPAISA